MHSGNQRRQRCVEGGSWAEELLPPSVGSPQVETVPSHRSSAKESDAQAAVFLMACNFCTFPRAAVRKSPSWMPSFWRVEDPCKTLPLKIKQQTLPSGTIFLISSIEALRLTEICVVSPPRTWTVIDICEGFSSRGVAAPVYTIRLYVCLVSSLLAPEPMATSLPRLEAESPGHFVKQLPSDKLTVCYWKWP